MIVAGGRDAEAVLRERLRREMLPMGDIVLALHARRALRLVKRQPGHRHYEIAHEVYATELRRRSGVEILL